MCNFVIYARKSSESEDRQVLSIEAQVEELTLLASSQSITVDKQLSESKSAKTPGRPIFSDLIASAANQPISGIFCWSLDRLARNPVDGAAVIWALELGQIESIITPRQTYRNQTDHKFLMQLEFGMAKKYVDDLSDNVKRGNRTKLQRGELPGLAPLGYLNDRGSKTIVPDPERFHLIRRCWELFIQGTPISVIASKASDSWGFRTPMRTKRGAARLHHSTLYRLLQNPFYYGAILRQGKLYPGNHKPMITKEEFDRVQRLLRKSKTVRTQPRSFPFTQLLRCGECGCAITAESRLKGGRTYTYYHCTKKKPGVRCSQKHIRAEKLESQLLAILEGTRLSKARIDWCMAELKKEHGPREEYKKLRRARLERNLRLARTRRDRLVDMFLAGSLEKAEFDARGREVDGEIVSFPSNEAILT